MSRLSVFCILLICILRHGPLRADVYPADGAVLATAPAKLRWPAVSGALRYEVFFAEDRQQVLDAQYDETGSSSAYLGSVSSNEISVPADLSPGTFRYWRADAVLDASKVKGTLHHFRGGLKLAGRLSAAQSMYDWPDQKLALSGDYALAGFPSGGATPGGGHPGNAMFFRRVPGREEWEVTQVLNKPAGTTESASFGAAVAIKGDTAWIGAPGDGNEKGSVFQYRMREDGQWVPTGLRLRSPLYDRLGAGNEFFGVTLALGDSWLAVGAVFASYFDEEGYLIHQQCGAIDIFDSVTGVWQTRLYASKPRSQVQFGLTISASGNTLAGVHDPLGMVETTIEIFNRGTDGKWTQTASLSQPEPQQDLRYGDSISLSKGVLLVGAPAQSSRDEGRIYVYEENSGQTWRQTWQFSPPEGAEAYYTTKTALHGDRAAIYFSRLNLQKTFSEVELWQREGETTWTKLGTTAPTAGEQALGGVVALALSDRYLLQGGAVNYKPLTHFYLHNSSANVSPYFKTLPERFAEEGRLYDYRIQTADENKGDVLSLSAGPLPSWLSFVPGDAGGGRLAGVPPAGSAGEVPVVLVLTDASGFVTRQNFVLKVLPPDSLPVIRSVSPDQTVPDHGRLELSASPEDGGAASWQWYVNGSIIPGQISPTLVIEHAQASDTGLYTVRIRRGSIELESPAIQVTVIQNPDRFGGDWPTQGGGVSRNGRYPAALGDHMFLPAWAVTAAERGALNQTATGGGMVLVSQDNSGASTGNLKALILNSGEEVWSRAFGVNSMIAPPVYHRGAVYGLRRDTLSGSSSISAIDASTGVLKWASDYSSLGEVSYLATPAVTDSGIHMCAWGYGGISHYDLNGVLRWKSDVSQRGIWTPMVHEERLFLWAGDVFTEMGTTDGMHLWTVSPPYWEWIPHTMQTFPASEDRLTAILAPEILRVLDLEMKAGEKLLDEAALWTKSGSFFGSPAITEGIIYAITPGAVRTYGAADGAELGSYPTLSEAGEPQTGIHQPVILDDHVLVSSLTETWIFDRASRALKQRLPAGGPLTYTDGYLLIAGADGVLRAFAVNQPPALTPPAAPLAWSEDAAAEYRIPVSDPEEDAVTVTAESKPAWLTLSGPVNGEIILSGTPDGKDAGSFTLKLTVSDNKSGASTADVSFTVLEVNDAPVAARTLVEFVIDEDGAIPAVETRELFSDEEDGAAGLTLTAERPPVEWISRFDFDPVTGRLLMTPAADHNGTVLVPVRATDSGGLTAEAVLSVQIRPVNDAPRLTGLPEGGLAIETEEDAGPAPLDLEPFVTDPESPFSILSIKVKETGPAALAEAGITPAGELLLTPKPDAFGEGILVLEITDSENLSTELPVKFTVRPVNDAPRASAPAPVAAKEDAAPLSLPGRALFSDIDDTLESLTLTLVPAPEDAPFTAALLPDGSVRVSFRPDASGAASFTLRAADAGGLSAEAGYQIHVEPVPDAPAGPGELPSPAVAEDGSPVVMDLAAFFKDADAGDTLSFTLAGNDRPELFSSAGVDPATGALRLAWAPYAWGTARLTVRATDGTGLSAESSFTVTLPAPPAPRVSLKGTPALNRQTGLLEQTVAVTNAGPRAIAGFRLWLDCGEGAELYNGMSGAAQPAQPPPAAWLVPRERPVAAGETVEIVLELYSPRRAGTALPHSAEVWNPASQAAFFAPARAERGEGAPFAVSRALRLADGMLVEFPSEPRAAYRLDYSPDGVNWTPCPLPLRAGGTAVQWLDRGPPRTGSHPLNEPRRFYRAVKLQN